MSASVDPTDTGLFREVLGHFGSGVVVVSATVDGAPLGLTCQSFASVSLDPPLVSFAVSRTSRRYPRIRDTGRFCVNVLADGQVGLSQAFAVDDSSRWGGVDWEQPADADSPVLAGSHAWIDCRLESELPAGDHTIVVGRVTALAADSSRHPLLYYRGEYRALAGAAAAIPALPADRIVLRGLHAHGRHGVLDAERVTGQSFGLDLELELDTRPAAASDDLVDTVDYGNVATAALAVLTGEPVALLETLAERVAGVVLTDPRVGAVTVTVHKPHAPLDVAFDDVAVAVRRSVA